MSLAAGCVFHRTKCSPATKLAGLVAPDAARGRMFDVGMEKRPSGLQRLFSRKP